MKKFLSWTTGTTIILIAGFLLWKYLPITKNNNSQTNLSSTTQENINTSGTVEIPKEVPKSVSFFFGGDMMFDRSVNHTFKDIGFDKIFTDLDKSLFEKEIVFANLEGPVSDKPINDDYTSGSMIFNMPTGTLDGLKAININGVSLANNHTLNAGNSGFLTTQSLLRQAGIKYGGSQNGFSEESVIKYDTEVPISIITVDFLSFNNIEKINNAIAAEKSGGRFVVVFPHWGEEYSLTHTSGQKTAAKAFIAAGANLIIGNHPHVVEDVEVIDNVPVFYSLGNFVFDQAFSKDTQEGLLLTGELTKDNLSITINPTKSEKIKMQLMNEADKKIMLDRINNGNSTIEIKF